MKNKTIICVGAALIDESYQFDNQPCEGTSNPSVYYKTSGGVARNIAHHLALLGETVELISHFGADTDGTWLQQECTKYGIGISYAIIDEGDTGRYAAFLSPEGDLIYGAVSTHFEELITPAFLQSKLNFLKSASLIVLDCNLSKDSIQWLINVGQTENIPVIIEPVSVAKASKLAKLNLKDVLLITPNMEELCAFNDSTKSLTAQGIIAHLLDSGLKNLWIRKGKSGSILYSKNHQYQLDAPTVSVSDSNGAGDAALSGWIYAWLNKKKPDECLNYGHAMAALVLQVKGAIIQNLTPEILEKKIYS